MLFEYSPAVLIYLIPAVLISLTIHELAHGYISYRLGDPTAKNAGRLTLNPLKHLDPVGALMFLFARFGWAKPVPINPMYYRDRKKGTMVVSLAGPLSNVLLALIFALPMQYIGMRYSFRIMTSAMYTKFDALAIVFYFCSIMYRINIGLAVFNILPVPPLDGSKILGGVMPSRLYYKMLSYQHYISIGFLLIIFIFPRLLEIVLFPFTRAIEMSIEFIVNPIVRMLL